MYVATDRSVNKQDMQQAVTIKRCSLVSEASLLPCFIEWKDKNRTYFGILIASCERDYAL